jgi:hypothetical protein
MRSFAAGKIDVYFGSTELGARDDLEQAIVDFIDGATTSLDIAVQEIDSMKIAEAIINARATGSVNSFLTRHAPLPRPRDGELAASAMEYESEYRLVSASCSSLYLRAEPLRASCRHFHPAALACRRLAKTFNPKVVGSIPTRPIQGSDSTATRALGLRSPFDRP